MCTSEPAPSGDAIIGTALCDAGRRPNGAVADCRRFLPGCTRPTLDGAGGNGVFALVFLRVGKQEAMTLYPEVVVFGKREA